MLMVAPDCILANAAVRVSRIVHQRCVSEHAFAQQDVPLCKPPRRLHVHVFLQRLYELLHPCAHNRRAQRFWQALSRSTFAGAELAILLKVWGSLPVVRLTSRGISRGEPPAAAVLLPSGTLVSDHGKGMETGIRGQSGCTLGSLLLASAPAQCGEGKQRHSQQDSDGGHNDCGEGAIGKSIGVTLLRRGRLLWLWSALQCCDGLSVLLQGQAT